MTDSTTGRMRRRRMCRADTTDGLLVLMWAVVALIVLGGLP